METVSLRTPPSPLPLNTFAEDVKDLLRDALPEYFHIMNQIYDHPAFRSETIATFLISRYTKFLYLVAECSEEIEDELIPPFELEAIWLCHTIRTIMYRDDCQRIFGKLLHRRINVGRYDLNNPGYQRAAKKWNDKYHDSIALDLSNINNLEEMARLYVEDPNIPKINMRGSEVVRDNNWTRDFRKLFDFNEEFIGTSMEDYVKYMFLVYKFLQDGKEVNEYLYASQKVDISWHTHMLNTKHYRHFCIGIFKGYIEHTPWPDLDKETEERLHFENLEIWKNEYGEEYIWNEKNE